MAGRAIAMNCRAHVWRQIFSMSSQLATTPRSIGYDKVNRPRLPACVCARVCVRVCGCVCLRPNVNVSVSVCESE